MEKAPTGSVGDLLAELKNNYAAELGNKIDDIELHILKLKQARHFQEAVRQIHSMKGTAGTYGFMPVSTICHHMEDDLALLVPAQCGNDVVDKMLLYIDLLRQVDRSLPSSNGPEVDIDDALAKLQGSRHSLRILLVDGSKTIPALIRDALSQPGTKIKCMEDGYLALGVLLMQPFELLIASEEIGSLTGSALISAVKANGKFGNHIKTILLSSTAPKHKFKTGKPDYQLLKNADLTRNIKNLVEDLCKP